MAMATRKQKDKDKTDPSSHTSYVSLHTLEKLQRLHRLQQDRKRAKLHIDRLRKKISSAAESEGVLVDEETHEDLKNMVSEYTSQIEETTPEDSFKRLFWEVQRKAASLKNSKSMR